MEGWKAWGAAIGTALLGVLEWLIGNPLGPEGHLVLLVIIMSILDFVSGTTAAIATRTWRFARLKQGLGKLALWGFILVIARQCGKPVNVMGGDYLFKFVSDYLLIYLVLVDLISALKHVAALSLIWEVEIHFLTRLIDVVQRWHDAIPVPDIKKPKKTKVWPGASKASLGPNLATQQMDVVPALDTGVAGVAIENEVNLLPTVKDKAKQD